MNTTTGSTERQRGNAYSLKWPRLTQGTLVRRYQRFKADVKLRNGFLITAHCPNSGSMLTCSETGRTVYLTRHNSPKRKLKYTWEMIEMETSLVGINTSVPNQLLKETLLGNGIGQLSGYRRIRTEVRYGRDSRIDLLLEEGEERCYVEVKNCTLVHNGIAYFPDAVTSRGLKHLVELQEQVRSGNRAVMFYIVQRMDAKGFRPADRIDEAYGKELRKAVSNGVEVMVYDVFLDLRGIRLNQALPYEI